MKLSGKMRIDHGTITFLVNSEKPRDAAMRNTGTDCCALAPQLVYVQGGPKKSKPA